MTFGDTEHDASLRDAWHEFCEQLKTAGDLAFADPAPATPLERAVGLRYIARNIAFHLRNEVEYADPLFPQLWQQFTPTMKWGGDNPDCVYLRARIDGEHTYRVVGNRGAAHFIALSVHRPVETVPPGESAEYARLLGDELEVEWDGSFVLTLSPEEQPGNWIPTMPDVERFLIRQFFGDWEHEQPMSVRIERVDAEGAPAQPTPDTLIEGLRAAAEGLIDTTAYWRDWQERYRANANNFMTSATAHTLGAAPGGVPMHCYFEVQPDEALVIRFTPPVAYYWNFELNNYWMASVDYRYHLSSINSKQAALETDGSATIVVSHEDPGVPNWLGTDGHCEGHLGLRWMQADSSPVPETQLVKLADLAAALPASARRITPEARAAQLRGRRIGVDRRFPL